MPHISNLYLKEFSYELDHLLGASPAAASVLDIMAASGSSAMPNLACAWVAGSRALPREAFAEDEKAVEAGQGSLLAENANTTSRQT